MPHEHDTFTRRSFVKKAGAAGVAIAGGTLWATSPAAARARRYGKAQSPLRQIVISCQENRSFDHYFGYAPKVQAAGFGPPPGYTQPDGSPGLPTSAQRSYDIRGNANQMLPGNLRAQANVNYFSSIESSQTFNTNIYDISRNQRAFGGNVVGAWGTYSLNGTLDHREYFYDLNTSVLSGSWPRVSRPRDHRGARPGAVGRHPDFPSTSSHSGPAPNAGSRRR